MSKVCETMGDGTNERTRSVVCFGAALVACAFVIGGCEKPIFTRDEPVSQFDRLQKVRNTSEPAYIPDEFGNLRPNLTGRLSNLK